MFLKALKLGEEFAVRRDAVDDADRVVDVIGYGQVMAQVFDGAHVAGGDVARCADECKVFHGVDTECAAWRSLEAEDGETGLGHGVAVVQGFEVCCNGLVVGGAVAFEGVGRECPKLLVAHGDDQAVNGVLGIDFAQLDAVFVLDFCSVGPGVGDDDGDAPALQFFDQVSHFAVADVGAVFFEGDAHDADFAAGHVNAVLQHALDDVACGVAGHVVVHAAASQDDLRVVTQFFGFVREVIRVHANAVAADHAGAKRQEVPLAACGLQHLQCVDADALEDDREFVDEGDVQVALAVFNHFGSFGHFEAAGFPGARFDDAAVQRIDRVGHCGCAATGNFADGGQGVDFVAGVDSLGAVAAEKVLVELEAAELFEHGHTHFFGGAGVDGGFVNDHVARLEHFAHGFAGFDKRGHVGAVGLVHWGGHGDDEDLCLLEVLRVGAVAQLLGALQFFGAAFQGVVFARLKLVDSRLVDVKTDGGAVFAKLYCEWQAHIA